MRKIILYTACSLNGKIARPNGDVDWLEAIPNPDKTDHGYSDFYNSIDTTIQGYNTYNQIIAWGIDFPYADKINYVLTRKHGLEKTDYVEFISEDHIDFIKKLKRQKGGDIWLIGGGQVNTLLFNEGLIDDIQVFFMPLLIPEGIDLFEGIPDDTQLELVSSEKYSSGAIKLRYRVKSKTT